VSHPDELARLEPDKAFFIMDESTLTKWLFDAGIAAIVCFIVLQFISVLKLAMTSQAGAYDSLRQWFASELTQRDADIRQEKAERMKLEGRFDDQCRETEQLKTRIAELETQLAEKIAEIERLKESNKQLKDNDEKKDGRIKEQNDRISDLEREIKHVKEQRDELVKRLDDLLSADDKGNGKDRKEKKIADRIDEQPSVRAKDDGE